MDPGFSVNGSQFVKQNKARANEQMFEEKVSAYLRSTDRTPPGNREIKQSVELLFAQKITLPTFCKKVLNSTNSNDLAMVSDLAEKFGMSAVKEEHPQQVKSGKSVPIPAEKNEKLEESKSREPASSSAINIVQTTVKAQVLLELIVKLIKQGNPKEALEKLGTNGDVLEKMLTMLSGTSQLAAADTKSMLLFFHGVLSNSPFFNNNILAEIKKKYDQLRKKAKGIFDAEELNDEFDDIFLSDDAKKFIRSFSALKYSIAEKEEDISSEVKDAYHALLARMGINEDAEDGM